MMSIAFERSTGDRIERPALHRGISFDTPETAIFAVDRRLSEAAEEEDGTSTSSSVGRNRDSESEGGGRDSGDGEVQSEYTGPLDCLDALEEVLPIKGGMSKFYNGISKSFTSLADIVSCSSIKEIAKPQNAFTRKRKNLLAHASFWDKTCNFPARNNIGGISKKPTNSNRSSSSISSNESINSDNYHSNA